MANAGHLRPVTDPVPTARGRGTWRSRAFGLTLDGDFSTELFDPFNASGNRLTTLRLAPRDALGEHWNGENAVRQLEGRRPNGRLVLAINSDPAFGYHVWGEGHGDYVISPDGTQVTCMPERRSSRRWQRFLIGQILPLAASLQGLEILHASAVRIGNQTIGFVGDSGAGKTTLAANLLLRGATFVADDVIALERSPEGLLAHPGTPLIGIKSGQADLVDEMTRRGIASVMRADREETLCKLPRPDAAAPLGRLYFIDRETHGGPLRFDLIDDARLLMTATFSVVQRDPARLERLLDVAARIATSSAAYWIRVPPGMTAPEMADAVERHVAAGSISRSHTEAA
jgi:hypothetical protein